MSDVVLLPDAKTWDELFEFATLNQAEKPVPKYVPPIMEQSKQDAQDRPNLLTMDVGPYCCRGWGSGYHDSPRAHIPSLWVKCTDEVYIVISQHAVNVAHDTLHFEVIYHSDGRAVVYYKHSQIIGGRAIAVIDAFTVPHSPDLAVMEVL